ncbi:hypothetical protein [Nesterenkonia sp. Act20]|uniref:hypothetical protein n=1 Tax=Nesterenkonia sp. Act20 TaxID=1483432 RepID=UPI00350E502D
MPRSRATRQLEELDELDEPEPEAEELEEPAPEVALLGAVDGDLDPDESDELLEDEEPSELELLLDSEPAAAAARESVR